MDAAYLKEDAEVHKAEGKEELIHAKHKHKKSIHKKRTASRIYK